MQSQVENLSTALNKDNLLKKLGHLTETSLFQVPLQLNFSEKSIQFILLRLFLNVTGEST